MASFIRVISSWLIVHRKEQSFLTINYKQPARIATSAISAASAADWQSVARRQAFGLADGDQAVGQTTNQTGFTLVELMISVAIVAILAGIGISTYSNAQAVARDAQRRETLNNLATALETFKTATGAYPITPPSAWYGSDPAETRFPNNNGNWIPGLAPDYIKQLPKDPKGGLSTFTACGPPGSYLREYLYRSEDGKGYKLLSHCGPERAKMSDPTDPLYAAPWRDAYSWQVCQGDTACNTY